MSDWIWKAAEEIASDPDVMPWAPDDITINVHRVDEIIKSHQPTNDDRCPVCGDPVCPASAAVITPEQRRGVLRLVHGPKEPPLLQCVDCKNTESCAGAMARQFNRGRCVHCGGYFRVVRA